MLKYLLDEISTFRTWSDKSHITKEDVPKLWKFIDMVTPEEGSDLGQTRISLTAAMAQFWTGLLCINPHCSEFVDIERLADSSDSLLLENCRTSVVHLDCYIHYQKNRCGQSNQDD